MESNIAMELEMKRTEFGAHMEEGLDFVNSFIINIEPTKKYKRKN
jgi:hypothetical protein